MFEISAWCIVVSVGLGRVGLAGRPAAPAPLAAGGRSDRFAGVMWIRIVPYFVVRVMSRMRRQLGALMAPLG